MANIDPNSKGGVEKFVKDGLENSGFDAVHILFKSGTWLRHR
jgi:hypothetical protein